MADSMEALERHFRTADLLVDALGITPVLAQATGIPSLAQGCYWEGSLTITVNAEERPVYRFPCGLVMLQDTGRLTIRRATVHQLTTIAVQLQAHLRHHAYQHKPHGPSWWFRTAQAEMGFTKPIPLAAACPASVPVQGARP